MIRNKNFLISIPISEGTYAEFISSIVTLAKSKISSYVCVANVHMLITAYFDAGFAKVVKSADLVTPDGMPIAKAVKSIHGINQERVAGMDLLQDLLPAAEEKDIPVYFYGGTPDMLENTTSYVKQHYEKLRIAGTYSPPFRALEEDEEQEIANRINATGAGIVFVALGCPKQERWMASMKGKVNVVMVGIGGALAVLAGEKKRAPVWMQKNSLEWLYRLMQEPRRLIKRYFVTNLMFLYLYNKALITRFLKRK